ncbi:hypothetical protein F2Q68_00005066 [Brassica cretica]|uniref:Uncharacterized protein n=1 Tax=Brassica cretica TaxID=69181 RepID=A0A8S9J879_BRACR|nr:hypothetical protein F2Q68_00005066 [Brassica cretica]
MNLMKVSHMRNFSTCEDVMEQINSKQKLLGKEHISAVLPTEPTARRSMKSFHHRSTSVQNHNPLDPYGYAREIVGHVLQVSREDTADILQMANGVDNLFMQQRTVPTTQKEFDRRAFGLFGTRKLYSEEKDEYGVYRDDQGYARDVDGHIINVSKEDIRKLIERALRDEHNYICLPEHASSFPQTKLVPEIYTKDEINEMFYGVCGAQEKQTSVDDATNRGRLVPKVTSDMSDTHTHGEEISADTYATLRRHQFNLESLRDRLQNMENTTATMKEKWRRGDEAM